MKKHTLTYLVGSEDLPWQQSGMDIEPLASVTTNPTPKPSLKNTGQACRSTKTSEKYEASYTQESLFSREDFLANHSQSQASNEARMTTVTSGQKCCALYKKQGQLGSLVRMLLGSSTWHSTRCVLTWKVKVTKSNRSLFQLAVSMPRTAEIESGFWLTPTSVAIAERSEESMQKRFDYRKKIGRNGVGAGCLAEQVKWSKEGSPIGYMTTRMWPTPTRREYFPPRLPNTMSKTGRNPMTNSLGDAVQHLEGKDHKQTGLLNPNWVEWLMGYPIGWTELKGWVTPSSRKSRQKSSDALTK